MQLTAKLKNKSTVWSATLKVRVLDVVTDGSGNYFQNISGINTVLTDTTNWFKINSPGSGGGSSIVTVNKTVSDILGTDPDFYLDLSAAGLPAFPAGMSVYVDLTGTGAWAPVTPVNYNPINGQLHGMNSPSSYPAQLIKILAV